MSWLNIPNCTYENVDEVMEITCNDYDSFAQVVLALKNKATWARWSDAPRRLRIGILYGVEGQHIWLSAKVPIVRKYFPELFKHAMTTSDGKQALLRAAVGDKVRVFDNGGY